MVLKAHYSPELLRDPRAKTDLATEITGALVRNFQKILKLSQWIGK